MSNTKFGVCTRATLLGLCAFLLTSCGGGSDTAAVPTDAQSGHARALAVTPARAALAQWTPPIPLSLVPISGAVLASSKVLLWSADFPNGDDLAGGRTYSTLYDPVAGTATDRLVSETQHEMFCPGTARLPDGRLLVNGGVDSAVTSIYDPAANSWSRGGNMNYTRGYNASTPLWDGSLLTMGGSWSGIGGPKPGEVFNSATNSWRTLSGLSTANPAFETADAAGYYRSDNHMWLIPTANGHVLHAGPSRQMNWIDTSGDGSSTPAGLRADDTDSMNGNAVMYDAGKILALGGGVNYDNADGKNSAFVIDTTTGAAVARSVAPMAYGRVFSNSVVLPTGQVVVMGGQTHGKGYSDDNSVLAPELWDPQTETFTVLPAMSVARNYHSLGLLMADARVISAGGGLCNCVGDHPDMQILSPPYLFNADGSAAARPAITAAPAQVGYGSSVSVTTDSPVTDFALVRLGATTHTVNNDQRRIALTFTGSGTNYQLAIPTNPGLLLPGQWMLFAMNANGTPSVATIVTVTNTNAPVLLNPGNVAASTGQAVNVPLTATTSTGTLAFSASGLPSGLTIDAASGSISGMVMATGRYVVTIKASNGTQSVSTDVVIRIETAGANTGTGLTAQYFGNTTLSDAPTAQRVELPNITLGPVCAGEGGTCTVSGTQLVAYGAPGAFFTKVVTGSVSCAYTAWGGDPAPNVVKSCYVGMSGTPSGVGSANLSARWSGQIEATASGATLLEARAAAGVRVWVNQQLVIDNWSPHDIATSSGTVTLTAGQRYPVTIEYLQTSLIPQFKLLWQPAGDSLAVVPLTRLYPTTAPSTSNISRGQPATQSSTSFSGDPGRAVDGNTDGNFANNSVTHTSGLDAQDWWQVDLGRKTRIDLAQLWNRTDCCSDRLGNFMVFVADSDMSGRTLDQLKADATVTARSVGVSSITPNIGIPIGVTGRYMRVQLTGTNNLSLAEVQVYGDATVYKPPTLNGIADLQTPLGNGVSLAIVATDPAGSALSYAATGLPAGLSIDAQTGAITGTTTTPGTSNVTVSVVNAGYASASASFAWTVLGGVPAVVSLPAPVAVSGSTLTYNPLLGAGASSQFSWNFGDGSSNTPYASSATIHHAFSSPGIYTVTLSIRTVDGQTSTKTFLQAIFGTNPTALARASSNVMLEPRNGGSTRLWAVNPDNDSVSVFDTANNTRVAEIPVGTAPRTLALAADGRVWIANRDSASISIVSPASLSVVQTIALPRASQPFGLVINPNPNDHSALVTLEASGQLLRLHGTTGQILNTLAVGDRPRHLAITSDGSRLLVSRFITRPLPGEGTATVSTTDAAGAKLGGEVLIVDPSAMALRGTTTLAHSERPDAENQGRGIPNYLGAAAIAPDGKTAWVPSKQDNIKRGSLRDGNPLNFQNTVRSISSRIDLGTLTEDLAGRVDHDNAGVASAAVYHPTGAYVFVALETNRQVAVIDAAGKRELLRYEVGLAPQGLAVSDDGLKLYVSNFMERSVSVIDLLPLVGFGQTGAAATATIATVTTEKLDPTVLRGKQLFYDARDPRLARDSYMSCASCHNDAGTDGRTWDFTNLGEGLRNTIPLRGRAGMGQGFLHWSANFDEVQDFEGQIRSFSGGTGLMADADFNAGTRSQALGDKKAGLSADLDALAAYLGSLTTFAPTPYRNANGTLTTAAQAGKTVFQANGCASCHGGTGFTLSADGTQLRNIGTLKASSGGRLGGKLTGIDIPTLRDVWATAPYLHDGSAATLSGAVSAHNNVTLNAPDLANVVAYLQQIGGEEVFGPVACAAEGATCSIPAGMTADVYYGTNGTYVMRSGVSSGLTCSAASFGGIDPTGGAYKSCSYLPTGSLPRTACGGFGATCSLPAGAVGEIYFGAGSNYSVRTGVTGAVCGYAFTDPSPGASESCSFVVTASASPPPASALTACSSEGGTCSLPAGATGDVYYGSNGKYALRTGVTGSLACNSTAFSGDPVTNVFKSCAYVATNTVTKTACAADGGFCTLPAGSSGDVYYGAAGKFAMRSGVTGLFCNTTLFGDPNPGTPKNCTYVVKP